MGFAKDIERLLYNAGVDMPAKKFVWLTLAYSFDFGLAALIMLLSTSETAAAVAFLVTYLCSIFVVYVMLVLSASRRIALAESMLPDFLSLMSSNIRSGFSADRALLSSARKEFGPLTKEVNRAVKLAVAGKPFDEAFETVGESIDSNTVRKSVRLIVEGTRAGGNLAELLEQTASDVRRFNTIKSEVSSSVMQYRMFLFAAAGLGAPFLFGTANFIIGIVANIKSTVGLNIIAANQAGLPLMGGSAALSPELTLYFSIGALFLTSLFTALAGGVISTGKASDDAKYFPVLLGLSLIVFAGTRFILERMFSVLFLV
ncbi:Type II secretion system (T2SS), protein F [uncultured archaeon]|nr:Type II secretion system (T2SS), protein F [uncultured archaeon]